MYASTRHFDHVIDLNDVARGDGFLFVRDGVGIAGRGIALRTTAESVTTDLQNIKQVGSITPDPIALGIIPFLHGDQTHFVIPKIIVRKKTDQTTTLTIVANDENECSDEHFALATDDLLAPRDVIPSASSFHISPVTPISTYLAAVTAARDAVRAGKLIKVVIARDISVTSDEIIDVHAVLLRLRATFGSSYRYSIDGFIGASPELLVAVQDSTVTSHPLAGTTTRTGDPATDARLASELQASAKNQIEHRVVVDMVHDTLLPFCSFLDWQPDPSVVSVANVQHLGTSVVGQLNKPTTHVLTLARALSPTPALGGYPTSDAIQFIQDVEGFSRGNYGGAVGWIDAIGNGTWAVAIRCAQLSQDKKSAHLFAGGGIVAQSEPLSELVETQAKFQAMLSAIVRP